MFRSRAAAKARADGGKKHRTRDRAVKAAPAPEANAELQYNIDVCSKEVILFIYSYI
jgi:cyclin-dependent kinase 12/13